MIQGQAMTTSNISSSRKVKPYTWHKARGTIFGMVSQITTRQDLNPAGVSTSARKKFGATNDKCHACGGTRHDMRENQCPA